MKQSRPYPSRRFRGSFVRTPFRYLRLRPSDDRVAVVDLTTLWVRAITVVPLPRAAIFIDELEIVAVLPHVG